MSVIIEMSIFPMDKGESVSRHVARAVEVIHESGLPYVDGPMSTSFEGDWDQCMQVVDGCYKALEPDCHRILLYLRADARKDRAGGLTSKMQSIESKLGKWAFDKFRGLSGMPESPSLNVVTRSGPWTDRRGS